MVDGKVADRKVVDGKEVVGMKVMEEKDPRQQSLSHTLSHHSSASEPCIMAKACVMSKSNSTPSISEVRKLLQANALLLLLLST